MRSTPGATLPEPRDVGMREIDAGVEHGHAHRARADLAGFPEREEACAAGREALARAARAIVPLQRVAADRWARRRRAPARRRRRLLCAGAATGCCGGGWSRRGGRVKPASAI